jgi:hypothetical protein
LSATLRAVSGFSGYDPTSTKVDAFKDSSALPPIIARHRLDRRYS